MKFIAHRGYCIDVSEQNRLVAFKRAFDNDFGVETDFRDYKGELVISHDIPNGSEMSADKFFWLYSKYPQKPFLALNIKANGLQAMLKALIEKYNIENYFCFDMSAPESIDYIVAGLKIFSRVSEYEKEMPFYNRSSGVCLDCFVYDWFSIDEIKKHLNNNKKVCIVSSDLHKRDFKEAWEKYKLINDDNLMICTDYPQEAKDFFYEQDKGNYFRYGRCLKQC